MCNNIVPARDNSNKCNHHQYEGLLFTLCSEMKKGKQKETKVLKHWELFSSHDFSKI